MVTGGLEPRTLGFRGKHVNHYPAGSPIRSITNYFNNSFLAFTLWIVYYFINLQEELKGAVKDCDNAIEADCDYLKAILRRAKLQQELDNLHEALRDFKRVLELDPNNNEAKHAVTVSPNYKCNTHTYIYTRTIM